MGHKYSLKPQTVKKIKTKNRRICTKLPVPESLKILKRLEKYEPISMQGQPPVIWDKAEGFHVYDRWGNKWLDWSSCVLVANAGHARKEIIDSIKKPLAKKLIATYVFPHEERAELCEMLAKISPTGLNKVFLLSTGSEATECCIKLARTYGTENYGKKKHIIVSFDGAFHGRTLGAQMAGGIPAIKTWITKPAPGFVQVPFPDGFRNPDTDFKLFEKTLKKLHIDPSQVAGVISESFQGIGPNFFPKSYAKKLRSWCNKHDVVLIMDEVQAGFGRSGKLYAFQHYGITPDLIACGKGISSSLPISAVIGKTRIMNIYAPGSMTSTHSASPLPVASAIANLKLIKKEKLVERAAKLGPLLTRGLEKLIKKYPENIGIQFSKGLVAGLQIVKPGTLEPDSVTAHAINEKCFQKGLLMFAPVGLGGGCIKIAPPLIITREALAEGLSVLEEAFQDVLG